MSTDIELTTRNAATPPALTAEDELACTPPVEEPAGAGSIILLVLLSPFLLVLFLLLGLVWLFLLPFRCMTHHHSGSYRTRPIDVSDPSPITSLLQQRPRGDFFQSSRNGVWLFFRRWIPEGPLRGVVYGAHGFGEHISRDGYQLLAQKLNQAGFAFLALDHQGHGHSTGDRAFFENIDDVIADYIEFMHMPVQSIGAEVPKYIFGHSMGGLIALSAAVESVTPSTARTGFTLSGLILSSPCLAIDPKLATPPLKFAAKVLSNILPKLVLAGLPASYLSRNEEAVKRYEKDPLIWHGGARARVGAEMLREMKRVTEQLPTFKTPILLLHGTKDAVVPPFASTIVFNGVNSVDKTFIKYGGLFHEIFEDAESERFFSDIVNWLTSHSGPPAVSPASVGVAVDVAAAAANPPLSIIITPASEVQRQREPSVSNSNPNINFHGEEEDEA